jgi:hypothetical protein
VEQAKTAVAGAAAEDELADVPGYWEFMDDE